ncbi:TonB-dependent receptor plug domain-containing protein [Geomonas sp.]|uniref:TonB-dependent receptor plug domain-containing protein n=1 Tax=Geomonas sp. TaxID=2651584 RepID=UPI002B45FC08|nr:TonB-dependent receptor [Geomonas sp.]HJV34651.1 TonB-dependent receptor [Geomonas sp.]
MFFSALKSTRFISAGFTLASLLLVSVSSTLAADIDDSETIGLFSDEKPLVATSPIPRPTSKIAENVTVITADDILRINAHTLADVLQTVPGIQLDFIRTPGAFTFFNLQGAMNTTVLVLIDGIRQNDFDQDIAFPALIPVQQIERIEIIKGASSGSWGYALGGVINIVTKSGNPDRAVSGLVSSSIGSRFTADSRAELSGTEKSLSYYLTAGHLRTDGLTANTDGSQDNLYGKLAYTLPGGGTATLGLSQVASWQGVSAGAVPQLGLLFKQDAEDRHRYGFLKFQQPFEHSLNLDLQIYATDRDDGTKRWMGPDQNTLSLRQFSVTDSTRGAKGSLSWGDSRNNLVLGGEYLHVHGSSDFVTANLSLYDRTWDSYAAYLNGTWSIGDLSVLPGVRYDATGISGDHTSYTLGLTYQVNEHTTLRAYAAQGFTLPFLITDNGTQKVRTVQAGVETGVIPLLWAKGTFFYNSLRNNQLLGSVNLVNTVDQNNLGFELEARTTPLYGIWLTGGYTYLDARDDKTGKRLQTDDSKTIPSQIYKMAVNYDQADLGLHGALTGSGVDWNAASGTLFPARSRGIVWDLNLSWKPASSTLLSPELFFTAHNLFDAVQTTSNVLYTNPGRWYEGGARLRF